MFIGFEGKLIGFEGPEGAGKSTQAKRFAAAWRPHMSVPVLEFREPGSSSIGANIRELLLHSNTQLCDETELFLLLAERAQLMRQTILPALARKEVVVLDRSTLSTLAYQMSGRIGLPMDKALPAIEMATCEVVPDMTFLLLVDPEVGLARKGRRGDVPDRIESENLDFHGRVYNGYVYWSNYLAHRSERPWPICTIETDDLTANQVFDRIQERFNSLFIPPDVGA